MLNHPLPSKNFTLTYTEDPGFDTVSAKAKEVAANTGNIVSSIKFLGPIYRLTFVYRYINFKGDMFDIEHNQAEVLALICNQKIVGDRSALDNVTNTLQLFSKIKNPGPSESFLTCLVVSHDINMYFVTALLESGWRAVTDLESESKDKLLNSLKNRWFETWLYGFILDIRGLDVAENDRIYNYLDTFIQEKYPDYEGVDTTRTVSILVISDWFLTPTKSVDNFLWCYMETTNTKGELIPVFPNSRSRAKSARK